MKKGSGSTALESKELMDALEQYKDGSESLPSRSKSECEENPQSKLSKRFSKRHRMKCESLEEERHSSLSKPSNERPDFCWESQSKEYER